MKAYAEILGALLSLTPGALGMFDILRGIDEQSLSLITIGLILIGVAVLARIAVIKTFEREMKERT